MNPKLRKRGLCLQCQKEIYAQLTRFVTASGSETYAWQCGVCKKINPFGSNIFWIKKVVIAHAVKPEEMDEIPTVMKEHLERCTRCGKRGAEIHHWAPRGIFGDKECDLWPKDYLCLECHKLWHKLVTPQLVKD